MGWERIYHLVSWAPDDTNFIGKLRAIAQPPYTDWMESLLGNVFFTSLSTAYPASALLSKKATSLIPDASGSLLGSGPLQTPLLGVALFGWYLCGRSRGELR